MHDILAVSICRIDVRSSWQIKTGSAKTRYQTRLAAWQFFRGAAALAYLNSQHSLCLHQFYTWLQSPALQLPALLPWYQEEEVEEVAILLFWFL